MWFQDLNWMDVDAYLQQDDRVILITGATEQHAYLSLASDVLIPSQLAMAAADSEKVLIAPPLNFGVSDMFVSFPGTMTLSQETFNMVVAEIVQSLLGQGFGGFFILNGHSRNKIPPVLNEMRSEGDARIHWYDWRSGEATKAVESDYDLRVDHGNWSENFPFTRVVDVPAEDKGLVNLGYIETGETIRNVLQDGSFGGPYRVDEAITEALFEHTVNEIVALLQALRR